LFAETSRRGGWRGAGDGDASVVDEHVDSAAVKMRERVREERQRKVERIGGKEGRRAHRRCRNWLVMLAGALDSGEKSLELGAISGGEGKRGRGRCSRGLYSGRCRGGGVRVLALGKIDGYGDVGLGRDSCPGEGDDPDRWVTPVGV
jgi:hypothetical protein